MRLLRQIFNLPVSTGAADDFLRALRRTARRALITAAVLLVGAVALAMAVHFAPTATLHSLHTLQQQATAGMGLSTLSMLRLALILAIPVMVWRLCRRGKGGAA